MIKKHMDEARQEVIKIFKNNIAHDIIFERVVIIDDLFGSLHAIVWSQNDIIDKKILELNKLLSKTASPYWSGNLWNASKAKPSELLFFEQAWKEGQNIENVDQLRIAERHRNRGAWLGHLSKPPWNLEENSPPIVVFYSFKGGVGRTTALASFAIQRARLGERAVIIDFDLDAPGIGQLLAADDKGNIAQWGVVDYILESHFGITELRDYYHACRLENVTGSGEILVIPSGMVNSEYLGKLVRVDFEPSADDSQERHPIHELLVKIKNELNPQWILIDARAGISEPAGILLNGIAHLNVLFGTYSEQSWQGIRLVIYKLGAQNVYRGLPQNECLLVQAMIPEDSTVEKRAKAAFTERARDEFSNYYYAEDPEDPEEDKFWYIRDLENEMAPHVPVCLTYQPKLAHFEKIEDIADSLAKSAQYIELAERIIRRVKWSET